MIDGRNDKTGVSEYLIGVVMADEIATPAVRDDDERQFLVRQWTIFHRQQRDFAEFHLTRRLGAGIPHGSLKSRAVGAGGYVDGPDTGALRERRDETEDDRAEPFASVHR
jgi:hypothetical protein